MISDKFTQQIDCVYYPSIKAIACKCVLSVVPTRQFHCHEQCVPCFDIHGFCASWEWILLLFRSQGDPIFFFFAMFMNAFSLLKPYKWQPPSPPCRLDNVNNLVKCANLFSDLILSSFDMDTRFVPFIWRFPRNHIIACIFVVHAKWILHRRETSNARWKGWINVYCVPFYMHINVGSMLWFSWFWHFRAVWHFIPKQRASHHY